MKQEQCKKNNLQHLLIAIKKSKGLQTNQPHQDLTQEEIFNLIFNEKWGVSRTMTALVQHIRKHNQNNRKLIELAHEMEDFIISNKPLPFLP